MPTWYDPYSADRPVPVSPPPTARLRRLGISNAAITAIEKWWATLNDAERRSWAAALGVVSDKELANDWDAVADLGTGTPGEVTGWAENHRTPIPAANVALFIEKRRPKPRPAVISKLEAIATGNTA